MDGPQFNGGPFKIGRGQKCEVILSSIEDFWINVSSPSITEFKFLVREKMCSQQFLNEVEQF